MAAKQPPPEAMDVSEDNNNNNNNKVFSNTVARIVNRVALEEGHEGPSPEKRRHLSTGVGPLTHQELAELSFLCTLGSTLSSASPNKLPPASNNSNAGEDAAAAAAANLNGFATVEGDELMALIALLDRHVNIAAGVHLIQDALRILKEEESARKASEDLNRWLQREGVIKTESLRMGLEAASVIVFIVTTEGVDRRAMNEDAIEASITLMRLHLAKSLVPALNQTGHLLNVKSHDRMAVDASPSKRRRRSAVDGTNAAASKELKKVYKLVLSNVTQHILLAERLEKLIDALTLDDQQLLMLTSSALHALEVDCNSTPPSNETPPAQQLQLLSISLVTAAFRKYPMHREIILEDLFPMMLRLPTGKRSLRTFALRYASVPDPQSLSAWNASLVGTLLPNGAEPHFIQMMTAMVLSLVQACVVQPVYETAEREEEAEEEGNNNHSSSEQRLSSGLVTCQTASDLFCAQLLKRCARKGGVTEFRPILTHMVEDLLLVFTLPEYPAAELLLRSFTRQLSRDVVAASPKLKISSPCSPAPETTYLNTAFQTLGNIVAVEARILAAYNSKALKPTTDVHMSNHNHDEDDDDGTKEVKCYCEQKDRQKYWIACDCCSACYHGTCVGVNRENVPDEWRCDSCRLARIIERERLKHQSDGEHFHVDELYALHHAYLSIISHRGAAELQDATQFHLARWIQQLDDQQKLSNGDAKTPRPKRIIAGLQEFWSKPGPGCEPLSEEGTNRMILSVLSLSSPMLLSFRQQIQYFVSLMGDATAHSLRKLSLKAIERTVQGDPGLMQLPIITKAVSKRLADDSISVREAAVSLVGAYVVESPAVASCFQPSLLGCLKDVGVSVRKRAVRIFQEILLSNPRYKGRSAVCDAMLKQAADPKEEDSVRDLIHDLFIKLWLEDGDAMVPVSDEKPQKLENNSVSNRDVSPDSVSGPGVVTPIPTPPSATGDETSPLAQKRVDIAAEQMMEVVRAAGVSEHLETLLSKLLRGGNDTDKGRKKAERRKWQEEGRKQCDQIVNALFELLVSIEEQRATRSTGIGMDLAATLQTIGTFAEFSPERVLAHIQTIVPSYLEADNDVAADDESRIVGATCDIIHRLATVRGAKISAAVGSDKIAKNLVKITYTFGTNVSESAIRALSVIAECQDEEAGDQGLFRKKLLDLAKTFYTYLYKKDSIDDFSSTVEKIKSNKDRALAVLGLICQYNGKALGCDTWENDPEIEDETLVDPKDLVWENCGLACYKVFAHYLLKIDVPTKCAAIRAFGGLFTSHPRLMLRLEQIGLIEAMMSSDAHSKVQLSSLKCWQRILVGEEKRVDGGKAKVKMDADRNITAAKRISGDQDSDSNLFGGVLTNHAGRLFEMTQSLDRVIRLSSLEVVGSLLRQGQVNPNDATPFLFALQGDIQNSSIRTLALQLLMTEGEKRPDILRQRVCAGVKRAYDFQRSIYPDKVEVSALVNVRNGNGFVSECVFSSVYKECVGSNRKQRRGFFDSLLGLFELKEVDDAKADTRGSPKRGTKGSCSTDLGLLSFVSQILASLPYGVASDPLYIIYKISSLVTLQGNEILEQFASLLRPVGLCSNDEYDETNFSEDALENAARSKFPARTPEARALSSGTFDAKAFEKLCRDGTSLVLLLRLKSFLCCLYHLSETRCLEFDPNPKERVVEKSLARSDLTKPFDSSISAGDGKRKGAASLDSLIRQYAEFRRLMREAMSASLESKAENSSASGSEDDDEEDNHPSKKRAADEIEH